MIIVGINFMINFWFYVAIAQLVYLVLMGLRIAKYRGIILRKNTRISDLLEEDMGKALRILKLLNCLDAIGNMVKRGDHFNK